MAFGYAAPDYQTRAQAGMPLDPSAPDQTPMPMPAVQAPQPQPQGQGQPYKPSFWDVLQGVVFDGQSPANAGMAARQRQYQVQQQTIMMDALKHASPDQSMAMLLNPGELGKALASHVQDMALKEGETRNSGVGGPSFIAPKMGLTSGDVPYAFDGSGFHTLASQLPGQKEAKDGIILDKNLGPTGGTYSLPQIVAAGSNGVSFTPEVSRRSSLPALVAGNGDQAPAGGGQGAGAGSSTAGPRGIRNNNFGNVRPLPNGQSWAGQTGVDADGYAVFGSPADGVKASATNLDSYAKQGINTLQGLAAKWAPASDRNNPTAYAHYLAGKVGVGPTDQIDLADKATQAQVLRGIFDFENGPKAMAAWRAPKGAGPSASTPASPEGGGQAPGFGAPFMRGGRPEIVPASDPLYGRYPPGTVLQKAADGTISAAPGTGVTYDQRVNSKLALENADDIKEYRKANTAWGAMLEAAAQPQGGMRAYAMRDTFARLINPGAVARAGTIAAIKESQGVPENVRAYLLNLKGDGDVPPQTLQQILDVAHGFLLSHYATAKGLTGSFAQQAQRNGIDPREVTPDLPDRPPSAFIPGDPSKVPAGQRKVGIYATPKGPMEWTGAGWTKPF